MMKSLTELAIKYDVDKMMMLIDIYDRDCGDDGICPDDDDWTGADSGEGDYIMDTGDGSFNDFELPFQKIEDTNGDGICDLFDCPPEGIVIGVYNTVRVFNIIELTNDELQLEFEGQYFEDFDYYTTVLKFEKINR